jgi:3-deoxy-manno-octulosonate cytidylyltransferase (CMP-KDO synthetase)
MKAIGVIPARYGSTRLAGKVLLPLAGKPMIQHVWERVKKSKMLSDVIIACDDEKIIRAAKEFGAKAVLTSVHHPSGTDRIAEAVSKLKVDIVVNIQGDEPLIHHKVIDELTSILMNDPTYKMATVIKRIQNKEDISNPNVVKVVIDKGNHALYFSRAGIPFDRDQVKTDYYKHLGIYAYQKEFLLNYKKLPKSKLEESEKLEQLRALEAGYKIKTILTDLETIGVDTAEDLQKVEQLLGK